MTIENASNGAVTRYSCSALRQGVTAVLYNPGASQLVIVTFGGVVVSHRCRQVGDKLELVGKVDTFVPACKQVVFGSCFGNYLGLVSRANSVVCIDLARLAIHGPFCIRDFGVIHSVRLHTMGQPQQPVPWDKVVFTLCGERCGVSESDRVGISRYPKLQHASLMPENTDRDEQAREPSESPAVRPKPVTATRLGQAKRANLSETKHGIKHPRKTTPVDEPVTPTTPKTLPKSDRFQLQISQIVAKSLQKIRHKPRKKAKSKLSSKPKGKKRRKQPTPESAPSGPPTDWESRCRSLSERVASLEREQLETELRHLSELERLSQANTKLQRQNQSLATANTRLRHELEILRQTSRGVRALANWTPKQTLRALGAKVSAQRSLLENCITGQDRAMRALRRELESLGRDMEASSDSEVALGDSPAETWSNKHLSQIGQVPALTLVIRNLVGTLDMLSPTHLQALTNRQFLVLEQQIAAQADRVATLEHEKTQIMAHYQRAKVAHDKLLDAQQRPPPERAPETRIDPTLDSQHGLRSETLSRESDSFTMRSANECGTWYCAFGIGWGR